MKATIKYLSILTTLLILIASGCKKDDDNDKGDGITQKTYVVYFDVVDSNGSSLIFSDSGKFNPDSITLRRKDNDQSSWSEYFPTCIGTQGDRPYISTCRRVPTDPYNFTLRTLVNLNDTITDTVIIWSTNPIAAKNGSEKVNYNVSYNSEILCENCDSWVNYEIEK